jgi:hypothetical protein
MSNDRSIIVGAPLKGEVIEALWKKFYPVEAVWKDYADDDRSHGQDPISFEEWKEKNLEDYIEDRLNDLMSEDFFGLDLFKMWHNDVNSLLESGVIDETHLYKRVGFVIGVKVLRYGEEDRNNKYSISIKAVIDAEKKVKEILEKEKIDAGDVQIFNIGDQCNCCC